ncbi:hypothetical protein [Carnobacterium iners]|uniref:hypothetical protein n=1 Tax=Carnobacterium iners TaxID=1073423 RepID=UPI00115F8E7B|nr:hypothetical protein [Carnobacterium iners]
MILIALLFLLSYQRYFSDNLNTESESLSNYSRIVKTDGKDIKIYKDAEWETIKLKGVELNSFKPGHTRFETSTPKNEIIKWLDEIGKMNANVIKVPYIQSPSFYAAIYDYNLNREKPIYVMHEIMLDEKAVLEKYDAFNEKILDNLKKDVKKTINVINGQALILSNKRSHRGLYLKDISKYNLGLIIGTNTNPEIVTLTNERHKEKKEYDGKYFSVKDGSAFEVFIGEVLNFSAKYEIEKYGKSSLLSFLTSAETDSFEYKHESNLTKHANINIEHITPKKGNNLFVSYKYHIASLDFLEYEYEEHEKSLGNGTSVVQKHLDRLNNFYEIPIVISDTGISSSRAKSKIDQIDGFDRGGFSEKEQGERIVDLLEKINTSGAAGAIVSSWQDDWTRLTSFGLVEDYLDLNNSSYWHDLQSSDESFGFLKFESGNEEDKVYLDGNFSDWKDTKTILEEDEINLKIKNDLSHLYILIEKENWSLTEDLLYLGIDVTPLSGSNKWEDEAEFSNDADFIIKLQGYNESRIVVNERYNLFNYLYKYYANIIEKKSKVPDKDSEKFEAIYLLNRKKFYLKDNNRVLFPIYYETGKLAYGIDNPTNEEFNSKVDFNKEGNKVEIKIPWSLLNVKDPLQRKAYGDFYSDGLDSQQKLEKLGFSINYKGKEKNIITKESSYNIEKIKKMVYFERLKDSYYIVKDYWAENPE